MLQVAENLEEKSEEERRIRCLEQLVAGRMKVFDQFTGFGKKDSRGSLKYGVKNTAELRDKYMLVADTLTFHEFDRLVQIAFLERQVTHMDTTKKYEFRVDDEEGKPSQTMLIGVEIILTAVTMKAGDVPYAIMSNSFLEKPEKEQALERHNRECLVELAALAEHTKYRVITERVVDYIVKPHAGHEFVERDEAGNADLCKSPPSQLYTSCVGHLVDDNPSLRLIDEREVFRDLVRRIATADNKMGLYNTHILEGRNEEAYRDALYEAVVGEVEARYRPKQQEAQQPNIVVVMPAVERHGRGVAPTGTYAVARLN